MLKFVSMVALLCLSACSDSGPSAAVEPCVPGLPTFHLSLKDAAGTLPSDASLRVMHGAGCEEYSLSDRVIRPCTAGEKPGVLFCTPQVAAMQLAQSGGGATAAGSSGVGGSSGSALTAEAAGAGGVSGEGSLEALECDVYSDGAITVSVWRSEKKLLERDLSAERNARCGVVTVSETIDL